MAIVTTMEGHTKQYVGSHVRVLDGVLYVIDKQPKQRVIPVSLLWGMINFERTVDESAEKGVAVFPAGTWKSWEA